VSDAVIEKFDLKQRYQERLMESAREALWRHCEVKILSKPGLVELSCEDKEPAFVQQMLSYFAEYGNRVFRRVGESSASEQVRFLERRVSELRTQAEESSTKMREFQELHEIVDLDSQAKAVVTAMATLESQRLSKQLELDYARTFSSADEATLQQYRSQLSVMEGKLRDLSDGKPENDKGQNAAAAKKTPFPACALTMNRCIAIARSRRRRWSSRSRGWRGRERTKRGTFPRFTCSTLQWCRRRRFVRAS
jgi:capsule polysaccharide export protein KpsE/RkpR